CNRVEFGRIRWTFRRREASSENSPGSRGRTQTPCQGEGRGSESRLPLQESPWSGSQVVRRCDRRWEVRCPDCERLSTLETAPMGSACPSPIGRGGGHPGQPRCSKRGPHY